MEKFKILLSKYGKWIALAVFLLGIGLFAANAEAKCTAKDSWRGPDKTKHLAVGVAMGVGGQLVFKDPQKAMLFGAGVAAAKEIYDSQGNGTCSLQDFAVTVAGVAIGTGATVLIVTPRAVVFSKPF